MLVLIRRAHEAVIIVCPDGTRLEIRALHVGRDSVKLGFTAPKNYVIDRHEIHERKAAEARQS